MLRSCCWLLFALCSVLSQASAADPLPAPSDEGLKWEPLFNGKNFDGWYLYILNQGRDNDPAKIFQVTDQGEIHLFKDAEAGTEMPPGYMCTNKEYSHYRLRFQYRWGEKRFKPREELIRDSGVIYHMVGRDGVFGVWPRGNEYQVQEGDTGDIFAVGAEVSTTVEPKETPPGPRFLEASQGGVPVTLGSGEGVARVVHSRHELEVEGWNNCEVIVEGDKAIHILNGKVNNRCHNMKVGADDDPSKMIPLNKGRILFQAEYAEVFLRNIEIALLPGNDSTPSADKAEAKQPEGKASIDRPQPTAAEESISRMKVADGYEVQLVAAEPLVLDPTAIAWGADGKLWVAEMADYPLGPSNEGAYQYTRNDLKDGPCGRIRYLEDTDDDGKYDKSVLFMEKVNFPNGVIPWRNGVVVTAAPEIFYAEDTTGDGKADVKNTLFTGFHEGNPQLRVNGLQWGLDGWLYCANGWSGGEIHSQLSGQAVDIQKRDIRGRDLKINPDSGAMDQISGVTEFGRNRNARGDWFGCDNSNPMWHFVLEDHYTRRNAHIAPPDARKQLMVPANPQVFPISAAQKRYHSFEQAGRFTSACAVMVYGDDWLFPRDDAEQAFVCEPVHNLVHREVITPDGVSYQAQRAAGESESEFLASTDSWFRPVMTRTGPDGALWVVDMYRFMIEHPEFLPPEGQADLKPFYRLGEDRGRIYRVVKKGEAPRKIPRFDRHSTAQLAAALESPNDWQRDVVQQQLLWKQDAAAVPALIALAKESERPAVRLQALWTLAGLKSLSSEALLIALKDPHPAVRRQATRLCETLTDLSPVEPALAELVADPDAAVRLQLAATLGYCQSPAAATALGQLLLTGGGDLYLRATALSSLNEKNIGPVFAVVLPELNRVVPEVDEAISKLLVAYGRDDLVVKMLADAHGDSTRQYARIAQFAKAFEGRGTSLLTVLAAQGAEGKRAADQALATLKQARAAAGDEQAALEDRIAALNMVGSLAEERAEDRDLLGELLVPQSPPTIQAAAIGRLASLADPEVAKQLLANWSGYGPASRSQVLAALVNRPAWSAALLDAIAAQQLAAADLDPTTRERLVRHPDADLRERATQLLNVATSGNRRQVIHDYQSALKLTGDATHGKVLFRQKCAVCHRLEDFGHEVGPNLAALTDKAPASLLTSILDPSQAVETRYRSYLAITSDGRSFSGILAAETGNHLTLQMQEGKQEVILRADLEALRATQSSLMPEGFERELQPQDMADLIAYVIKPQTAVAQNKAP